MKTTCNKCGYIDEQGTPGVKCPGCGEGTMVKEESARQVFIRVYLNEENK